MMSSDDVPPPEGVAHAVAAHTSRITQVTIPSSSVRTVTDTLPQKYQSLLDQATPYTTYRWVGFGVLLAVFMLRILIAQGWYIGN
jgi:hypothetical protein